MEVGTVDGWISLLHFLSFFNFSMAVFFTNGRFGPGCHVILAKCEEVVDWQIGVGMFGRRFQFVPFASFSLNKYRNLPPSLLTHHTQIWDTAKERIHNVFDRHPQEAYSLDFSPPVVSSSGDDTTRIWSMLDGTSNVLDNQDSLDDPDSLGRGVYSVAFSGNPDNVARI